MQYKHMQFKAMENSLEGYAATFGNVDNVGDVIIKGAFAKSLAKLKPKFCYQHKSDELIGVIESAVEDDNGLYIKAIFANTQDAQDARELSKIGAIEEMSIGYIARDYEYRSDGVRVLKEIELLEVSLVAFPANDKAKITQVKSQPNTEREFESFLRDVGGYSQAAAKIITAHGFKALSGQRDVEAEDAKKLADNLDRFAKLFTL